MRIIKQQGEHVTAELLDSLQDRVNTINREVSVFVGSSRKPKDQIRDDAEALVFELADKYSPTNKYPGDIEDIYFLHYREADQAYEDLQYGDNSEAEYMHNAIAALLVKSGLDHLDTLLPVTSNTILEV